MTTPVRRALLAALLLCAAPASAQQRRMDELLHALRGVEPMERIATFFPSRGAWEMVRTPRRDQPRAPVERLRFTPAETLAAIREGGPVCGSFGGVTGDVGAYEGALVSRVQENGLRWRHAGGGRFVPPGEGASSPVFVQWGREDGRWVVTRVGEEYFWSPRVLGVEMNRVVRDTTVGSLLPPERRYASRMAWFRDHRPVIVEGRYLMKYGLGRPLADHEVQRFGTLGVTPFFAERGITGRPEVVYALTGPGMYQTYQNMTNSACRD